MNSKRNRAESKDNAVQKARDGSNSPNDVVMRDGSDIGERVNPAGRLLIGSDRDNWMVSIGLDPDQEAFKRAKRLSLAKGNLISRLGVLGQAVPSLAVAGEASGVKLMEVVVNGELVRASDGVGLRAFAMNAQGISGQARLFDVASLQRVINLAAVWQVASVVVAQKHLADISKKLGEIKEGISRISRFLENQRKAKLLATYDYLGQLHSAIQRGDLPQQARTHLEHCEHDLLHVEHHLFMEFAQTVSMEVPDSDTFGTQSLATAIGRKIVDLDAIAADILLCLKARIVALHLLSLFPGEQGMNDARKAGIENSISKFATLSSNFQESLTRDISCVKSVWNRRDTLEARRNMLHAKRQEIARALKTRARQGLTYIKRNELLLEKQDRPTKLYLKFQDGNLVEARQAR